MAVRANDKIAQMCHSINYTMRWPAWLPLDEYLTPVACARRIARNRRRNDAQRAA